MKRSVLNISRAGSRFLTTVAERDFFGISDVTSKQVGGTTGSSTKLGPDQIQEVYQPLVQARITLKNKEIDIDASFGRIRFDDDNVPEEHGQYEPDSEKRQYEPDEIKQLFSSPMINDDGVIGGEQNEDLPRPDIPGYRDPYRVSEVQAEFDINQILQLFKQPTSAEWVTRYANKPPLFFHFESSINNQNNDNQSDEGILHDTLSGHRLDDEGIEETIKEASANFDTSKPILSYEPKMDRPALIDLDPSSEEYEERAAELDAESGFDKALDEKYDIENDSQELRQGKAIDHLKRVRTKRVEPIRKNLKEQLESGQGFVFKPVINLDSKGFNDYRSQVPDWNACRRVDAEEFLRHSIIYHNHDIMAVNKPYGLAVHPDEKQGDQFDITTLLHEVAKERRVEKVYLAHRLDKTTTGVLLFATSQERANNLNKLFETAQIKKTYWCITAKTPQLPHAIIDIPIGEYQVAGKSRRCLVPDNLESKQQLTKRHRHARKAITEYRVLATYKQAALIEVKPTTGVKHQIRCHLSFGINCPILGDHKYSHIERIAPQVLSASLLKALQLRQQKVRTLPMHLHAKSIVIPEAKTNGENLFIHAPIPAHFSQNMRALRLSAPDTK